MGNVRRNSPQTCGEFAPFPKTDIFFKGEFAPCDRRTVTRWYNVQNMKGVFLMADSNKIIYDWVTFVTRIHDVFGVIELLGLSDVSFINLERGMNGYPNCLHFGGISVCWGGRDEMGVCCCMSGQGCRSFETYGNGDYKALFDLILENYSTESDKRMMNLTRLDVAYDDFDELLDIDVIARETALQNYVSRFVKWSVTLGSDGCCVGIGSMRSNIYIRIYDKKAERKRDDLEHWVRCEIQLRKENAIGFAMLGGNICKNYFDVLNNYLRFVTPSETDSNKRRWNTAEWWQKFIESCDCVSIFAKPGADYNVMKLDSFVFGQCSGAIETVIDLLGVEKFLCRVVESRKGRVLNPKYKDIKNQFGTSSDAILDYLRERGAE